MDKNSHVYCTKCKHGEELLNSIINNEIFLSPKNCIGCCSLNPEDSMRFEERPNYKPLINETL